MTYNDREHLVDVEDETSTDEQEKTSDNLWVFWVMAIVVFFFLPALFYLIKYHYFGNHHSSSPLMDTATQQWATTAIPTAFFYSSDTAESTKPGDLFLLNQ